jgi:predicted RNA-binding Zn ribbon-like protein
MGEPQDLPEESEFEFSGGATCLDFANTVGDHPVGRNDRLKDYFDLLRWAGEAGLLDPSEKIALERLAARQTDVANRAFHHAIELRSVIYRAFSALASGGRPGTGELAALNAGLLEALPHLRVEPGESGYVWTWSGTERSLEGPLWPVLRSAAELLTSTEAPFVRECASETCTWLFVDRSRTRRRRWCDMKTCGNRAKARRHYERTKLSRSSD